MKGEPVALIDLAARAAAPAGILIDSLAAPRPGQAARRDWRAWAQCLIQDHGFLRVLLPNAHWVSEEAARSGQPWPFQLADWRRQGVRTVVSLRGDNQSGYNRLEKAACRRLGLDLVYFAISSQRPPRADEIEAAAELLDSIAYPALFHCKSGADRAGMMATLYLHLRKGAPMRDARAQMSLRYGHMRASRAGVIDAFFDLYAADGEAKGLSLRDWVRGGAYDPEKLGGRAAARPLGRMAFGRELGEAASSQAQNR